MEKLIKVTRLSTKIKELGVLARIEVDHPVLVRVEVARRLLKVANKLPDGLSLQVDSGYRGNKSQESIWNYRLKQNMGDKEQTEKLVSNPHKQTSPHTTGGAIDISLLDRDGNEINLSEPYVKYYNESQLISRKISLKAQKLRLMINSLMLSQGFAPNSKEYWHFSYGEDNWGNYYKKKPIYGEISLIPPELKYPLLKRVMYRLARRIWQSMRLLFRIKTNY